MQVLLGELVITVESVEHDMVTVFVCLYLHCLPLFA